MLEARGEDQTSQYKELKTTWKKKIFSKNIYSSLKGKGIFDSKLSHFTTEVNKMPVMDPVKRAIAKKHRLHMKICRECGARNAPSASKCRRCRSKNLRWKKRELVK